MTRRIDSLEAVRGLAAVAVLLVHSQVGGRGDGLLLYGWLGVPVFFVLSGLVLYLPFAGGASIDAPAFWRRRLCRIFPGYWLVLAVTVAVVVAAGGSVSHLWQQASLYEFAPGGPTSASLITPAWTLAVELSFYLLLPLLVWVFVRRPMYRFGVLFAVATVALLYRRATGGLFAPVAFADQFVFGMVAAVLVVKGVRSRWLAVAAAAVVVAAGLTMHTGPERFPFGEAFAFAVALALVPLAARNPRVPRALVWLGTISFGVYLWHTPVFWALRSLGWTTWSWTLNTAVALTLTIGLAAASYRLVELPAIRWARAPRLWRRRRPEQLPALSKEIATTQAG